MKKLIALVLLSLSISNANAIISIMSPTQAMMVGLIGCAIRGGGQYSDAILIVDEEEIIINRKVVKAVSCLGAFPIAGIMAQRDAINNPNNDDLFFRVLNFVVGTLVLDEGGRTYLSEVNPNNYDGRLREIAPVYNKNIPKLKKAIQEASITFQQALENGEDSLVENNVKELYTQAHLLDVPAEAVEFLILKLNKDFEEQE